METTEFPPGRMSVRGRRPNLLTRVGDYVPTSPEELDCGGVAGEENG
jgi:hypothetical protein